MKNFPILLLAPALCGCNLLPNQSWMGQAKMPPSPLTANVGSQMLRATPNLSAKSTLAFVQPSFTSVTLTANAIGIFYSYNGSLTLLPLPLNVDPTNALNFLDPQPQDYFTFAPVQLVVNLHWTASPDLDAEDNFSGYIIHCGSGEAWNVGNVTAATITVNHPGARNTFWATSYNTQPGPPGSVVTQICAISISQP